jgi:tRNA-binding protein
MFVGTVHGLYNSELVDNFAPWRNAAHWDEERLPKEAPARAARRRAALLGMARCPVAANQAVGAPSYPRPVPMVAWEDFAKVDVRVGRVVKVQDFPEARRPAWKLWVDFGPGIGVRTSSAQVKNYSREELEGRLVLAVVNLPPRQVGPFVSEVLTLGTYRDSTVLLVAPAPGAEPGDRLG